MMAPVLLFYCSKIRLLGIQNTQQCQELMDTNINAFEYKQKRWSMFKTSTLSLSECTHSGFGVLVWVNYSFYTWLRTFTCTGRIPLLIFVGGGYNRWRQISLGNIFRKVKVKSRSNRWMQCQKSVLRPLVGDYMLILFLFWRSFK